MKILGIMTGTSADGCDGAIVDFQFHGGILSAAITAARSTPFPADLRDFIIRTQQPQTANGNSYAQLHHEMGAEIARFCRSFPAGSYDAIAMHGQTVNHFLANGLPVASIQLGDSAIVAAATGVPVIHDIRAADIAAGGQGAPLVSLLDWMLYRGLMQAAAPAARAEFATCAFVNIGGIANATICSPTGTLAGDTGPGNCLLDAYILAASHQQLHYDADGAIARSGTINPALLERLLRDPYFQRAMPKSTGREYFNTAWLRNWLPSFGYRLDSLCPDVLATLTALTAQTIGAALKAAHVDACFLSGGGAKNAFLRSLLGAYASVHSTAELGVAPDMKEAVMMALIGYSTLNGLPGVAPAAGGGAITGARYASVLGSIALPPGGFAGKNLLADSHQSSEFSDGWPAPLIVTRTVDRHENRRHD